jgi:hypothetical protein
VSPRSYRIMSAIVFAGLWTAGNLWRATSLAMPTILVAVVGGVIVGLLWYWVSGVFKGRVGR